MLREQVIELQDLEKSRDWSCLNLAEDGKRLDGFVVVGDEIHHPVPALPQLLRVHRPHRPAAVAPIIGTTPVPYLATTNQEKSTLKV